MAALPSPAGAMRELALFAGAGGGILGGKLLGWRCVCAVEWNAYAASVLVARQNDGSLDPFPIWDDVQTFDGRPWRGCVDVISGGFPCQDISTAGKGAGIDGARSGMWSHMARIVGEVRPRFVLVENSPALTSRGLGRVLGDLAALGYDAEWGVLGACDAGAPHRRERIWIAAADAHRLRQLQPQGRIEGERGRPGDLGAQGVGSGREQVGHLDAERNVPDAGDGRLGRRQQRVQAVVEIGGNPGWWSTEPDVGRVAHGVAARLDRLKAIGNGQVPAVVALAWRELTERAGWQ